MTDEGAGNLPTAVTKAYDLLLWLINHVGKFPQSHRFVLGDRIESLVLVAYAREKKAHLQKANGNVQVLRLLAPTASARYIDSLSATLRIWTPCTSDAPPRMAQATWTASVISSMLDPFSREACV